MFPAQLVKTKRIPSAFVLNVVELKTLGPVTGQEKVPGIAFFEVGPTVGYVDVGWIDVGLYDDDAVGLAVVGIRVGAKDDGIYVGVADIDGATDDGFKVGNEEGLPDGKIVGIYVGNFEGKAVGTFVGIFDVREVGKLEGMAEGYTVGSQVG